MSKEGFKIFARNNPNLARKVNANEISWQKLYEMYELYGENSNVWNDYLNNKDKYILPFLELMILHYIPYYHYYIYINISAYLYDSLFIFYIRIIN